MPIEPFPFINKLVEGPVEGVPILLMGPPGVGKSTYSKQFILEGLKNGEKVIMVTTDEFPEQIITNIEKMDMEFHDFTNLFIVDCYSYNLGIVSTSPYSINPRNLQGMLITVHDLLNQGASRLILDSMTTLTIVNGSGVGMQFLHILSGWMMHQKASGLFILESGIHDAEFMNFLRFMFKGVIEMKIIEEEGELKRKMRVFSLIGVKPKQKWVTLEMVNNIISSTEN